MRPYLKVIGELLRCFFIHRWQWETNAHVIELVGGGRQVQHVTTCRICGHILNIESEIP